MKADLFDFFRAFLNSRSGLNLVADKSYLLETRLARILRERNFATLNDLSEALCISRDVELERQVVEAMTTNETLFFRDRSPFDLFCEQLLPEMMKARAATKQINIWCAACSTGQEPYSLAMLLDQRRDLVQDWKIRILATDLSTQVIERAKTGLYSQFEVQRGLGIKMLLDYFTQTPEGWVITPRIREMVEFRPLNLIRDFSSLDRFDIIFCRNVMIYFAASTRRVVFDKLAQQIAPDGVLILGASETVLGLTEAFAPDRDRVGIYRPVRREPAGASLRVLARA